MQGIPVESNFYLSYVRSPMKSIIHFFTGQTEIERVCKSNDLSALEYSMFYSEMLVNYKRNHPNSGEFQEDQVRELVAIKNITDPNNIYYVRKFIRELHCWKHAIFQLQQLKKQKYDKTNQQNEAMLFELWKNLKPNEKLKNRISQQWISIGFQGNDPATDFRGFGVLGLINLYSFSQKEICRQIFAIASAEDTQYFFSSASIFFTKIAFELVKEGKVPPQFWVIDGADTTIVGKFQMIFEMIFKRFHKFWNKCQDKSMMQFNVNLLQFQRKVKEYTSNKIKQLIHQ